MDSIEMLLNELESNILSAKKATFSNTDVVVNKATIQALIAQIRSNLPIELKEAQDLIREKDNYLKEAENYATTVVDKAREKSLMLVTESEIYNQATIQCKKMGDEAIEHCKEIEYAARSCAFSILDQVGGVLSQALSQINENKNKLIDK